VKINLNLKPLDEHHIPLPVTVSTSVWTLGDHAQGADSGVGDNPHRVGG